MNLIKAIEVSDKDKFEIYCNNLISQGFTISSSNCGFVNDSKYDFCNVYQAIFTRKEEDIKPISNDYQYISQCCKDGCEYFNNPKGCLFVGEKYIRLLSEKEKNDLNRMGEYFTSNEKGTWVTSCINDKDAISISKFKNLK